MKVKTLQIMFCSPILILLVAALLLPGASQAQDTEPVVRFDPASQTIGVGEQVSVDVMVGGVTDLVGVSIVVKYDPAIVEVVGDPGPGSFIPLEHDPEGISVGPAGEIQIAYQIESPAGNPVSGEGVVGNITFRGRAEGTTDLALAEVTLIGAGQDLTVPTPQDGQLTVSAAAPTSPLPTPTFTSMPSPTATPPAASPTPTLPPTSEPSPTSTSSPDPTATPTATAEPTGTPPPQPSATPTPTPQPTPLPVCDDVLGQHVVRPGETLYSIGRAYVVQPYVIAACNGILNPSLIRPNATLDIPNAPWVPVPPGPIARRQFGGVGPACRFYHTVVWGENLFRISLRYRVSMWAIAEANGIQNLHYIRAGEVLCIP